MNKIIKEKLNKVLALLIIVIAFAVTLMIMLKYKTEGETNLPFLLTKIMIVSSADSETKQENPDNYKWNMSINQYNDIYMEIKKNYEYKRDCYIKSVSGKEIAYMPNSTDGKQYVYDDNFIIKDNLTYNGASANNPKNLEIANQGGNVLFRIANRNTSEYVSNEEGELAYNGTLLKKTNVNIDDIKVNVNFDVVIRTNKLQYRGNISLEMPPNVNFDVVIRTNKLQYRGNVSLEMPPSDLEEKGVSNLTITDFSNVVFKREKD